MYFWLWGEGVSTINRCCQSDHREEAETNALHCSADCQAPTSCLYHWWSADLHWFYLLSSLIYFCFAVADTGYNDEAKAVLGDVLRQVEKCFSSSCWLKLTHLEWWFSHSCKDALTDRVRTLPSEILLVVQLARPHPRWSDFSETVWTLSSYIVHLRNTKRWGKIWTDLIKCNHMRCMLTFSGQMWLPDIHLIRYRKLHESNCRLDL